MSIVVAVSRNGVIGRGGDLPWRLPTDLRRFRELTAGHAVVMGRRTFESLPARVRPLPGRRNVVLSSNPSYRAEGAEVVGHLDGALDACGHDCFVIGGGETYAVALPVTQRLYMTRVDCDVEGDAFFPELMPEDWHCVQRGEPIAENGQRFAFMVYERRL